MIRNATNFSFVLCVSLLICLGNIAHGEPSGSKEYAIKAAFIYNFAKFVEWPAESMNKSEPFIVCILGENPFGSSLEILQGKKVKGKNIIIKKAKRAEDMSQCHIVFVGSSVQNLAEILAHVKRHKALTVGDTAGFARQGGVINFVVKDEMVRFEINLDAATQAGLKISSKLLKLASIVNVNNP